jgi:acyl carrier protein phosphodiesterase
LNYLVHLYLSGSDPEIQLGGLMGDFVKGKIPSDYPRKIALGLYLHRRIDTLAQNSSHTRQSRQRLDPKFGHGRGIIVDIFYDHFLAALWPNYSTVPLESYAADIYKLLQKSYQQLPHGLQQVAPRMIEYNWLVSYQHREVVGKALQRIAQRLSRPLPLAEGVDDLATHEVSLQQDFADFINEAKVFVKEEFSITIR